MIVRQTFVPSALATTVSGLVYTAQGVSGAGGIGVLPITQAPGHSASQGTAAVLVVNAGGAVVLCRWWFSASGRPPPQHEDFRVGPGQSLAVPIRSDGPDELAFYTPGGFASVGIIAGYIIARVDVGPIDVMPAATES